MSAGAAGQSISAHVTCGLPPSRAASSSAARARTFARPAFDPEETMAIQLRRAAGTPENALQRISPSASSVCRMISAVRSATRCLRQNCSRQEGAFNSAARLDAFAANFPRAGNDAPNEGLTVVTLVSRNGFPGEREVTLRVPYVTGGRGTMLSKAQEVVILDRPAAWVRRRKPSKK